MFHSCHGNSLAHIIYFKWINTALQKLSTWHVQKLAVVQRWMCQKMQSSHNSQYECLFPPLIVLFSVSNVYLKIFTVNLHSLHLHNLGILAVGASRKDFHTAQVILWNHPGLQLRTHAVTVVAFSKWLYSWRNTNI